MAKQKNFQEVIDRAIQENRSGEWLCYLFAVAFVSVGIGVLIWGATAGEGIVALAGSVASILFWPAMREARQIRKENMAICLLEAPLSMAETAPEAAGAIREAFSAIFGNKKD